MQTEVCTTLVFSFFHLCLAVHRCILETYRGKGREANKNLSQFKQIILKHTDKEHYFVDG